MMDRMLLVIYYLACAALVSAANPYAPQTGSCPSSPLVRVASGISSDEQSYFNARRTKAAAALHSWLQKNAPSIKASQGNYPTLALSTSGGGLRSLLTGAGVHQAFDSRDSDTSTSGLYQALTYESGLSGGSWMLSSIASNNWPTISSLQSGLWNQAFTDTLPDPPHFSHVEIVLAENLLGKHSAGFDVGVVDIYGRLLGYQMFYGKNGGVANLISGMTALSNFTAHNVPYPIITALNTPPKTLLPPFKGLQIEIHPYEFGSWDTGVAAFTPAKYMGSALSNGKPVKSNQCITGFDSQCFIMGTSSNIFTALVQAEGKSAPQVKELVGVLSELGLPHTSIDIFYAEYPNPFYKYPHSSAVQDQEVLNLVDGGDSNPDEGDPIWPMLHRDVDVLFVSANSADTAANFPSGVEIHNTYIRAQQESLSRMPVIPTSKTFSSEGLSNRSVVFGCYDDSVMTIVYMPNRDITYNSGKSTFQLKYTPSQTADMIKNGMEIATEGGAKNWGMCVACFIMKKTKGVTLPSECTACYKQYCYGKYVAQSKSNSPGGSKSSSGSNSGATPRVNAQQGLAIALGLLWAVRLLLL